MNSLPKSLQNEPLIDAIFEVRFDDTDNLDGILPGVLISQSDEKPILHRLPAGDIPQAVRDTDPNLAFVPVVRLEYEHFFVAGAGKGLSISCKIPYQKWPAFKKNILQICRQVSDVFADKLVSRFSVKYVNILSGGETIDQLNRIDLDVYVGAFTKDKANFYLQMQVEEEGVLHIVSVMTSAVASLSNNGTLTGTIIDIDSIKSIEKLKFKDFMLVLETEVDQLRLKNKRKFFSTLKSTTVEELGPDYG